MTKMAMVQEALNHLGEVPAETLSEHIQNKHGTKIDPKIIPVLRALIRDKEQLQKYREQSKALAMELKKKTTCRSKQVV